MLWAYVPSRVAGNTAPYSERCGDARRCGAWDMAVTPVCDGPSGGRESVLFLPRCFLRKAHTEKVSAGRKVFDFGFLEESFPDTAEPV